MDDDTALASLSVTHVYYDPDDYLSLLCAYLALLPQALCVVYATLIFSTREAEIMLAFAGQLACEVLNFGLKRLIKEERPHRVHGKGYGMPSSHAQFIAFWSLSLTLFLLLRHKPAKKEDGWYLTTGVWSYAERVVLSVAGLAIAGMTAWSRIYLNYHTAKQVAAGAAAGLVFAVVWFLFTAMLRQTGLLAWAVDTALARALRIRDLVVEEDMAEAGWEKWERKRLGGLSNAKKQS
ncbi:putative dolichyldiphosphatase [Escovopsis weberi]|uniref:Dolichyldiphosphatase n=1 Tax=Escovopsis weberi TaxID=150374 RepID=A0A0M9VU10_ESCWE|nr:putative dolichyldiphosphatase [Escovopsis weberi]